MRALAYVLVTMPTLFRSPSFASALTFLGIFMYLNNNIPSSSVPYGQQSSEKRNNGTLQELSLPDRLTAYDPQRFLRLRDVMEITGLSRSSIYSYMQQGRFPHSVAVGTRAVRWSSSSIYDWVDEKMARSLGQVTSVGGYHE